MGGESEILGRIAFATYVANGTYVAYGSHGTYVRNKRNRKGEHLASITFGKRWTYETYNRENVKKV